mmetsp:Transcript_12737/g.29307  ORF Transcript_12737/g.29307 Transcript_12737/m.29307 type:complete len:269 (-) Transcript_12737:262-1068(-)
MLGLAGELHRVVGLRGLDADEIRVQQVAVAEERSLRVRRPGILLSEETLLVEASDLLHGLHESGAVVLLDGDDLGTQVEARAVAAALACASSVGIRAVIAVRVGAREEVGAGGCCQGGHDLGLVVAQEHAVGGLANAVLEEPGNLVGSRRGAPGVPPDAKTRDGIQPDVVVEAVDLVHQVGILARCRERPFARVAQTLEPGVVREALVELLDVVHIQVSRVRPVGASACWREWLAHLELNVEAVAHRAGIRVALDTAVGILRAPARGS